MLTNAPENYVVDAEKSNATDQGQPTMHDYFKLWNNL